MSSYYVANGWGDSHDSPDSTVMRTYLAAIDPGGLEGGVAWLADEHGNVLEYNGCGVLVFEREGRPSRHLYPTSSDEALEIWVKLCLGHLDELEVLPWANGLWPAALKPEVERRRKEVEAFQLAEDRRFFDSLGPELSEPCRQEGCTRGRVKVSALCAVHHFRNTLKRTCPF
jgi:hypothetical protein